MDHYECQMCGSLVEGEDADQAQDNMEALEMNLVRLNRVRRERNLARAELRQLKAELAGLSGGFESESGEEES